MYTSYIDVLFLKKNKSLCCDHKFRKNKKQISKM